MCFFFFTLNIKPFLAPWSQVVVLTTLLQKNRIFFPSIFCQNLVFLVTLWAYFLSFWIIFFQLINGMQFQFFQIRKQIFVLMFKFP